MTDDQWHWKHKGQLLGPLTTEELDGLIQKRRVDDRDLLRIGLDEEWLSGRDVKALFQNRIESSPSEAASQLISRTKRPVAQLATDSSFRSEKLLDGLQGLFGRSGEAFVAAFGTLGAVLALVLAPFKALANPKVLLAVVFVILIAVLFRNVGLEGRRLTRIYTETRSLGERVMQLQERQATSKDWDELIFQAQGPLQETISQLSQLAKRRPIHQPTLWSSNQNHAVITRDLLMACQSLNTMLASATASPDLISDYQLHLTNAGKYVSGELSTSRPGAPKVPDHEGALSPILRTGGPSSDSSWLTGMLVVDGLIVAGGVMFWMSRKRGHR